MKIDKTTFVKGVGRWQNLFDNKLVTCMWNPTETNYCWTFPKDPSIQVKEDPNFFFQTTDKQYIKIKR